MHKVATIERVNVAKSRTGGFVHFVGDREGYWLSTELHDKVANEVTAGVRPEVDSISLLNGTAKGITLEFDFDNQDWGRGPVVVITDYHIGGASGLQRQVEIPPAQTLVDAGAARIEKPALGKEESLTKDQQIAYQAIMKALGHSITMARTEPFAETWKTMHDFAVWAAKEIT